MKSALLLALSTVAFAHAHGADHGGGPWWKKHHHKGCKKMKKLIKKCYSDISEKCESKWYDGAAAVYDCLNGTRATLKPKCQKFLPLELPPRVAQKGVGENRPKWLSKLWSYSKVQFTSGEANGKIVYIATHSALDIPSLRMAEARPTGCDAAIEEKDSSVASLSGVCKSMLLQPTEVWPSMVPALILKKKMMKKKKKQMKIKSGEGGYGKLLDVHVKKGDTFVYLSKATPFIPSLGKGMHHHHHHDRHVHRDHHRKPGHGGHHGFFSRLFHHHGGEKKRHSGRSEQRMVRHGEHEHDRRHHHRGHDGGEDHHHPSLDGGAPPDDGVVEVDYYEVDDVDDDDDDALLSPPVAFAMQVVSHFLFFSILLMTGFIFGAVFARCKLQRRYSKRIKELEAAVEQQGVGRAVAESIISSGATLEPVRVRSAIVGHHLKAPLME
jgi:hypothetical protein